MIVFLDTSSLIKLYHEEEDTAQVEQIISDEIDSIYLSELAILEFRSAMLKKVRTKEVSEKQALDVIDCFKNDYNNYNWIKLNRSIINSASKLLMKYGKKGLRTLDSIQFASALKLKKQNCIYKTADSLLKELFKEEKLNTV